METSTELAGPMDPCCSILIYGRKRCKTFDTMGCCEVMFVSDLHIIET